MTQINEKTLLENIEMNLAILEKKLKTKVSASEISISAKIPFKVVSIREIFLHRTFDLSTSSLLLFKERKLVPAILLVRALMETNSILFRINKLSIKAIEEKNSEELDNEVMVVLCGTRDANETEYKTKNILGYLEKINKAYPDYKEIYDRLSEFVHPNHDGCLGTYGQFDNDGSTINLGFDLEYNYLFYIETLKFLLLNLQIFMKEFDENEKLLSKLIDICERELE